jgi:hypothetical protein
LTALSFESLRLLAEQNPALCLKALKKIEISAAKNGDVKTLEELNQLRNYTFSKLHTKLPIKLARPEVLFLFVIFSFLVAVFAGVYTKGEIRLFALLFCVGLNVLFAHPFGHALVAELTGIRISGFYLAGKAKIEPTLLYEVVSYHKAQPEKRFWFHLAGVLSTLLCLALLALCVFVTNYALYERIFVVLLFIFASFSEVFNSTKKGDIARANAQLRCR